LEPIKTDEIIDFIALKCVFESAQEIHPPPCPRNSAWSFRRCSGLMAAMQRQSKIKRHTLETRISIRLNLDGQGQSKIKTGIPFFDHMLTLFAKHATVDLDLRCDGDLEVDAHHTVEDCGIALGQAVAAALGDKRGIRRYGHGFHPKNPFTGEAFVPMDECLARCVVDFSGRPHLVWRGLDKFSQKKISGAEKNQDMSSAFRFGLAREFFQGFTNEARCNLHLELLYGDEPHHIVEALFKAFARAVDAACRHDPRIAGQLPSTKGKL
jgi:imidazoleglycerol-phosphate dehydratase